ncbi:MAG: ABC transporter permease, partial [Cytophagaceae bacterium]|nr:ABC transporter permease [Gemmatimonadaceae bacterium]
MRENAKPNTTMDALLQDVRYAVRTLARRPGFALAAVLSLAIGIAATSAVFGVVNGILFKPVPGVQRPERLVQLTDYSGGNWADLEYATVQRFGEETALVEGVAAFSVGAASVATDGEPEVRGGLATTSSYFELLGVRPSLGRAFTAQEATLPSVAPLVLITDHMWRTAFEGRSDIVGQTVRVNGVPLEVIGILPNGFAGHSTGLLIDVFLPLGLAVPGFPSAASLTDVRSSSVESLARLRAGVTPAVAAAAFSGTASRVAAGAGQDVGRGRVIRVEPWGPLPAAVRGAAAAFVAVLTVLVGLALLMACTNVTSMLLARATERGREFAIRRALGAAPMRLMRQLVTEAVLLFAAAGVTGIALAAWVTGLTRAISPRIPIPGRLAFDFGLDWRVLLLSSGVTLVAGMLAGLVPGLHARGARLAQ